MCVCGLRWCSSNRAMVFVTWDVSTTGLKTFGSLGCGFLGTVIVQDVFHSSGTLPCLRPRLKMRCRRCPNSCAQAFSSQGAPSGPAVLMGRSLLSSPHTWAALTVGGRGRVVSILHPVPATLQHSSVMIVACGGVWGNRKCERVGMVTPCGELLHQKVWLGLAWLIEPVK